jgi:SAM-dependent methyltransferase
VVSFDNVFSGWASEQDVRAFLERVWSSCELADPPGRVLELGSRRSREDHDPTGIFPNAEWIGVDWREGPGVNLVGVVDILGKEGKLPTDVDVVLSVSSLEHDPRWPGTIRAALGTLKNGGVIALTCAGPGSPARELECSPPVPEAGVQPGTSFAPVSVAALVANVCAIANRDGRDVIDVWGWYERGPSPRSCVIARIGHVG